MPCFGPGSNRWSRLSRCLRHHQPPLPGRVLDSCRSTAQYPPHSEGHLRKGTLDGASALTERRDDVFGDISRQRRCHPGRHLQPAVFYTRVEPNFQAERHRWPRNWRPSLCDVTASMQTSVCSTGRQLRHRSVYLRWRVVREHYASMDMSAPKSKGMHVHVRERLPVSTEVEVEALDLPHSCPECERCFPTSCGLAVHRARWCRPGEVPASRRGQLADKDVKLAKRKASTALLPPMVMEGESLETVCQFDYLGCRFTCDGDDGHRGGTLAWSRPPVARQPLTVVTEAAHAASVCSTLTHGSEAWMPTSTALATLNGFNSRQLHSITGRSYRDEATKPAYDLPTAVRTRMHHWLGHILRMPADRLVRRVVLALGQRAGPPYQPGSLLIDTPLPIHELVMRAADRRGWARYVRSLSSLHESH